MLLSRVGIIVSFFAMNMEYQITKIEEEKVPLAAAPVDEYYGITVAVMVAAALALTAVIYLFLCRNCRKRIRELRGEDKCYCGWNLWHLKETVSEMELQKAEKIVEDMKESFSKNLEPLCANGES